MAKKVQLTSTSKASPKKIAVKKTITMKGKTQPAAMRTSKKTMPANISKVSPKLKERARVIEVSKSSTVRKPQTIPTLPKFTEVFNKKTMIILGVVLVIGLAYSMRSLFLAAMVNGQPISRFKIMREAEKAQGTQILDTLVMETLVEQKAREKGIKITKEAIDTQIAEIRQNVADQGQDFDQLLAMQNLTLKALEKQVEQWQTIEALVGADVEVTEDEIAQYLEDNKEFLPEDMSQEELNVMVAEQLKQQRLSERYQQWSEELRNEAKLQYFGQYIQQEEELVTQ